MASFYLGAVGECQRRLTTTCTPSILASTPTRRTLGDSWRFTPKLTLNYSLRWDYITPFKEKFNNLSFIDPLGANPGATGRATFPAGLPLPETSGERRATARTIPKSRSSPLSLRASALPTPSTTRPWFAQAMASTYGQAFYPGWDGGMSLEGFNKNLNLNETASGGLQIPAIYLNSGISASQVGDTQHIASDFDNGQTPPKYRPLDGNQRPYSQQWNMTVERELPNNFFAALSYVGTKGTHLPSSMSPLNVIDPLNPAIAAIGDDLRVSYNEPSWSGDLCQVRRQHSVCGLGKPDDKLRSHPCPGAGALSAVLRSAAGPERATRNLHLQLLPVQCRTALQRRTVCALVADGTEDVHRRVRYHPGNATPTAPATRETTASSRPSICSRGPGPSFLITFRSPLRSRSCTTCPSAQTSAG